MSTPVVSLGLVDRLDQMLRELDAVCCELRGDKLEHLSQQSKRNVRTLRNQLKRAQVEQVSGLVQTKQWDAATAAMRRHFPRAGVALVQEILVFVGDELDGLTSAVKWVGRLDVPLKLRAYEALYEQFKMKNLTEQPEVLLLGLRVKELSGIDESVRKQANADRDRIIARVVEGVQEKDYSLSWKIQKIDQSPKRDVFLNGIVIAVVSKFKLLNVENTLLLIEYSRGLPRVENCCYLISALMSALAFRNLLNSEQSLQLWSHAKYLKEEDPKWRDVRPDVQKLCTDALEQLQDKHKANMFLHYQKYFFDKDKLKIKKLHQQNWHLQSIVEEFVTWYFKEDDLSRVQTLLSAATETSLSVVVQRIFSRLHLEMVRCPLSNTFESLSVFFSFVKRYMLLDSFNSETPEIKATFEQLKSKAPAFLRLVLWPQRQEKKLKLVNKFFDSPLHIQQDAVVCSDSCSDKELLICSATLDPLKMQTSLSFLSGNLSLDALTPNGSAKVILSANRWRITPVDQHHVKISTDDGKFLMADGSLQQDISNQVVCLKRENSTDMQLWKIEPANKKIKIESDDDKLQSTLHLQI